MKTAILLADNGIRQIMFTPETEIEKKALGMIVPEDDISVKTKIKRGVFHDGDTEIFGVDVSMSQGGYMRAYEHHNEESVMFVITPKKKK